MEQITLKPSLLDEVIDFLTSAPTLEQIIAVRPSKAVQERVGYLLDQNQAGTLTTEERKELDDYLQLDHFMTLLKARARKKLGTL